jgi:hypothetical protein
MSQEPNPESPSMTKKMMKPMSGMPKVSNHSKTESFFVRMTGLSTGVFLK